MFAVLKTGGKQYKVAKDDIFLVEKLDVEAGATVEFAEVLMIGGDSVTIGAPLVSGALVRAEVLEHTKGPKVIAFVKRRRKHSSQRKRGHRQQLTRVRITEILASGDDAAPAAN
jgi:large subunit ribosomal protein L21